MVGGVSVVCADYNDKTPVEWVGKGLLASLGTSNEEVEGN